MQNPGDHLTAPYKISRASNKWGAEHAAIVEGFKP